MPASPGPRPRLLLDTNVVIAHEDDGSEHHPHAATAAQLVELAHSMGFEILLSNGTRRDFLRAPDLIRAKRMRLLEKYYRTLQAVPESANVRAQFPDSLNANDAADVEVLSTYDTGLANILVTEDVRMKRRAQRAGLRDVLSISAAVDWLRELRAPNLDNASAAHVVDAYLISRQAPIFTSLRGDYPEFDDWWTSKVVHEERDAIILGATETPDGLAVLKPEENTFDLGNLVLKVCTFKVMDQSSGSTGAGRRGELLLRAVIDYARDTGHSVMYMTVKDHHEKLLAWLERFGFTMDAHRDSHERIMVKHLNPLPGAPTLEPLDHAVAFGPRSVRVLRAHVVPIQYDLHDRLLPDSSPQISLFENEPCGNAIRKAYICRSPSRQLVPGDLLAFLRTRTSSTRLTAVGVVEQTFLSNDPAEIAARVRGRTVYSYAEIERLCIDATSTRPVLTILFRLDRRIEPPWSAATLNLAGVMKRSPQSIARISPKGVQWLRTELDASP